MSQESEDIIYIFRQVPLYYQSHLGEKLHSFKGRPERCFTSQLETTNIYLQPDKHNQDDYPY